MRQFVGSSGTERIYHACDNRNRGPVTSNTPEETDTVQIEGHTDARDLVDATDSQVYPHGFTKRRKTDIFDIQDLQELGKAKRLMKIWGPTNPADAGTKKQSWETHPFRRLRNITEGWYTPDQTTGVVRRPGQP